MDKKLTIGLIVTLLIFIIASRSIILLNRNDMEDTPEEIETWLKKIDMIG